MKTSILDDQLLNTVSNQAKESERKRMNHNFHQLEDSAQRMLNAIEPGSYIQPHKHVEPLKDEAFLILKGTGAILLFDESGKITDCILLDPSNGKYGVDIPGGVIHSVLSLEAGTVFYEVKPGPYQLASDKCFPAWAPKEKDSGVGSYYQSLLDYVKKVYPDAITVP